MYSSVIIAYFYVVFGFIGRYRRQMYKFNFIRKAFFFSFFIKIFQKHCFLSINRAFSAIFESYKGKKRQDGRVIRTHPPCYFAVFLPRRTFRTLGGLRTFKTQGTVLIGSLGGLRTFRTQRTVLIVLKVLRRKKI